EAAAQRAIATIQPSIDQDKIVRPGCGKLPHPHADTQTSEITTEKFGRGEPLAVAPRATTAGRSEPRCPPFLKASRAHPRPSRLYPESGEDSGARDRTSANAIAGRQWPFSTRIGAPVARLLASARARRRSRGARRGRSPSVRRARRSPTV